MDDWVTVIIILGLLLLLPLCVGVYWPIRISRNRRQHQRLLRRLLGDQFRENKSFVTSGAAIALDEKGRRFALSKGKDQGIIKTDEIVDLTFRVVKFMLAQLTIVTSNEQFPRIDFFATDPILEEMYIRLKVMRGDTDKKTPSPEERPPSLTEGERIELAIGHLTKAVSFLAEAIRQTNTRVGGSVRTDTQDQDGEQK